MTKAFLSVIIPVYNKWELTEGCLRSLREHTPGDGVEVIVADNGSSDATAHALEGLGSALFGPRFVRLRFDANRNFGPACNAGAEAATADLLFFLNNDTLLTPGWSDPLLAAFGDGAARADGRPVGAVGPLLLYPDDRVQHLGIAFAPGATHLYRFFPADHPAALRPRRVQALTAAALMLPGALFAAVGGFFPEYRNGFEDVDLCVHLGKAGHALQCLPASRVYHLESQTPGRLGDNTPGNNALLAQRCGADIAVDIHRQAFSDGYGVCFDHQANMRPCLPPEKEKEMAREAAGADSDALRDMLRREPLWMGGHDALARLLEQSGKYAEARLCRIRAASMLPTLANYRGLLRTAARMGDEGLRDAAERSIRNVLEAKTTLGPRMQALRENAAARGDADLAALYDAEILLLSAS